MRETPVLPNVEVLVNSGTVVCMDVHGIWMCASFCFRQDCDPKQQLPPMGTAEEGPLDAGTTSVLEPLTGPSAIPSHMHWNCRT